MNWILENIEETGPRVLFFAVFGFLGLLLMMLLRKAGQNGVWVPLVLGLAVGALSRGFARGLVNVLFFHISFVLFLPPLAAYSLGGVGELLGRLPALLMLAAIYVCVMGPIWAAGVAAGAFAGRRLWADGAGHLTK